jgi:hypothetical protein
MKQVSQIPRLLPRGFLAMTETVFGKHRYGPYLYTESIICSRCNLTPRSARLPALDFELISIARDHPVLPFGHSSLRREQERSYWRPWLTFINAGLCRGFHSSDRPRRHRPLVKVMRPSFLIAITPIGYPLVKSPRINWCWPAVIEILHFKRVKRTICYRNAIVCLKSQRHSAVTVSISTCDFETICKACDGYGLPFIIH